MLTVKAFEGLSVRDQESLQRTYTVIKIEVKRTQILETNGHKMIMVKQGPSILFTGLKRILGSPKNLSDNVAANTFKTFDVRIPLSETEQGNVTGDYLGERLSNISINLTQTRSEISPTKPMLNTGKKSLDPNEEQYMPLDCLNTFTVDWAIKVKVTKKYELKNWKNARGEGVLLNLDFIDKHNT